MLQRPGETQRLAQETQTQVPITPSSPCHLDTVTASRHSAAVLESREGNGKLQGAWLDPEALKHHLLTNMASFLPGGEEAHEEG